MERLSWLLVVAIIAGLIFVCTLILALYIILCEYYELKFHYLTPTKSDMVNKSSGYSSATLTPSEINASRGGKGGGSSRGGGAGSGSGANSRGIGDRRADAGAGIIINSGGGGAGGGVRSGGVADGGG